MIKSFTRYQEYRKCHRLWAFKSLGYEPVAKPDALIAGTITHAGVSAYLKGSDWMKATEDIESQHLKRLEQIDDTSRRIKAQEALAKDASRARTLITRYLTWLADYSATLIEPELHYGSVYAHPDIVCTYHGHRAVVDVKTGKLADSSYYDLSGQVDLYAWLLEDIYDEKISLVVYDLVGDENIYRHERPPRLLEGMKAWARVEKMPEGVEIAQMEKIEASMSWDCPSHCDFFQPCRLLTVDSIGTCVEFLDRNYWKEGEKVENY